MVTIAAVWKNGVITVLDGPGGKTMYNADGLPRGVKGSRWSRATLRAFQPGDTMESLAERKRLEEEEKAQAAAERAAERAARWQAIIDMNPTLNDDIVIATDEPQTVSQVSYCTPRGRFTLFFTASYREWGSEWRLNGWRVGADNCQQADASDESYTRAIHKIIDSDWD